MGGPIARGALDAERAAGHSVVPYCPCIRNWIRKHLEDPELVPEVRRAEFVSPRPARRDQG